MFTSVYDAHKNKNKKNSDKRLIGIAQLCLSAVLKIEARLQAILLAYYLQTALFRMLWILGSHALLKLG